jgi:hypothetical protein
MFFYELQVRQSQQESNIASDQMEHSHGWHTGMSVSADVWKGLRTLSSPRTQAEGDFVTKTSVMRQYAKCNSILENLSQNTDYQIVQMLCNDIDNLRDEHKGTWSYEAEIILLGVQLSIYTHHLEHSSPPDAAPSGKAVSHKQETATNIVASVAFGIAVRLIDAFISVTTTDPNSATPQRYLPKHYFNMLLVASAVIIKVRTMHPSATAHASTTAQNQLRQSYTILSAWSAQKMDEPDRAARIVEILSRAERQGNLKLAESCKDSRTGIALLSDAIMTADKLRERMEPSVGMKHNEVLENEWNDAQSNLESEMQLRMEGVSGSGEDVGVDAIEAPIEQWMQDFFSDWNFSWDFATFDPGRHYGIEMDTELGGNDFV